MVLELKNIEYEYRAIHLVKDGGEQKKDDYKEINPMQQVCTLVKFNTYCLSLCDNLLKIFSGSCSHI